MYDSSRTFGSKLTAVEGRIVTLEFETWLLSDRHVCPELRYAVEGKPNELDFPPLTLTFIL